MKLLIDTNVILDMVLKRKDCNISIKLFQKIDAYNIEAYITASTVTDLFYIVRKETQDMEQTYLIMGNILKLVRILAVSENDIQEAFLRKWKDFEDCVQYMAGKNNRIDYIVTQNQRDYEENAVMIMTPKVCIEMLDAKEA